MKIQNLIYIKNLLPIFLSLILWTGQASAMNGVQGTWVVAGCNPYSLMTILPNGFVIDNGIRLNFNCLIDLPTLDDLVLSPGTGTWRTNLSTGKTLIKTIHQLEGNPQLPLLDDVESPVIVLIIEIEGRNGNYPVSAGIYDGISLSENPNLAAHEPIYQFVYDADFSKLQFGR